MKLKKGFRQLVAEAEQQIQSRSPTEVASSLSEPGTLLVDLRDIRELKREGKIAGALHVPRGMLEFWIDPDSPYYRKEFDAAEQLILYCNKGWRSALATRALVEMGLDNVSHMRGGLEAWQAEELPLEPPPER
jgi:rhodanese-related sulfurtransferase